MPALVFPAPGPNNAGTTQWSPAEFGGFDVTGSNSNTPVNLLPWSKNFEAQAFTATLTQIYTASTTLVSGGTTGTYAFVVASIANLAVGQLVYGIGMTAGLTYVAGISGTTITLNRPFSTTGSGSYNFQDPNAPRTFTSTASGQNAFVQTAVSPSTNYVFSFYAKAGTATDARYRIVNVTSGLDIVASNSYYNSIVNSVTTTATGSISSNIITVASSAGLYIGMSVSAATGVTAGTKIIGKSANTITLSTTNISAVSGSITFTDNRLVRVSVPFTTPAGALSVQLFVLSSITSGFGTTQISSLQLERGTVATTYQETGPVSAAASAYIAPASKTYSTASKIARIMGPRAGYQRNVKPAPAVVRTFKTPANKTQLFRPDAARKVEQFKTPANKTSVLPVDHDINGPRISPALPVEYWNYNNQANIGQADTRVSVSYTPTGSSSTSLLTTLNYTATTYQYLTGDYVKLSDSASKYSAITEVLNASQSGPYVDAVNQQQYTTPGTYYWTAPVGVTSVDIVGVGAGAGGGGNAVDTIGGSSSGGYGGGGGGLGYKNNVTVTPGETYRVVVGAGGIGSFYCDGINGATGGGNTLFFSNKQSNISFQMISGSTNIYMTVDPTTIGINYSAGATPWIIFSQAIGNLAANTSYHITGFSNSPGNYYIVLAPTYWDPVPIVGNTNTTVVCNFESSTAGGFGGTPLLARTFNITGAPGGYWQGDGGGRGGYGGRMYNYTGNAISYYTGSGGGGAGGYGGTGGQGGWMSSDTNGLLNLVNGNGFAGQFVTGGGAGGGVGYPAGRGGDGGGAGAGGGGTDIFGVNLGRGLGGGNWNSGQTVVPSGGFGASDGANGGLPYTVDFGGQGWGNYGGIGGFPGGGGGGGGGFNGATSGTTYTRIGELGRGGNGAGGALRIMWGPSRSYPTSNTANQPVVAYNSGVASITVSRSSVVNFNSTTSNWSWIKWLPDVMPSRNALTSYPILDRARPVTRFAEFTMAPGGNYGRQLPYLSYGAASRYLNQSNTTLSPALASAYWNYNNQANTGQADTRVSVTYTPTGVSRTSLLTTLNYTATTYQYRKGDYVKLSDSVTRYTGIAELLNVSTSGVSTAAVNQQSYTVPDTYYWTAPVAVTTISVVSIGGGAGGGGPAINYIGTGGGNSLGFGGAGGGLGWKNNITVTPGESYRVVVGAGGLGSYYIGASSNPATAGGPTIFFDNKRSGLLFSTTSGQTNLVMSVSPTSVGIPAVDYAGTPVVFSQSIGGTIIANRVYYISDIGTTPGSYYISLSTYFSSSPGATPITWTATESVSCNMETSNVCGIGGGILANSSSTYYSTGSLGGGYKGDGGGTGGNGGAMASSNGTYLSTYVGSGGGGAGGYNGAGGNGGALSSDTQIHIGNSPTLSVGNGSAGATGSGAGGGGVGYPDGNAGGGTAVIVPYGQVLFASGTATGTGGSAGTVSGTQYSYTWTCPANVFSICVVCVGGGAGTGFSGGGGGGLIWANNIPVVPGQTYTVYTGVGGAQQGSGVMNGGNSSFVQGSNSVTATGGVFSNTGLNSFGGTYSCTIPGITYGGGNGGRGGSNTASGGGAGGGGGGGAGGYGGNGGAGGNGVSGAGALLSGSSGAGGGGAGGGGGHEVANEQSGSGGGGVGVLGVGSNGVANSGGGSGGANGQAGGNYNGMANGGGYGGGAGGASFSWGAPGAVRIIWPATRLSDGATLRAFGSTSGTTVGTTDSSTSFVDALGGANQTAGGGSGGGGVNLFGRGSDGGTAGSWAGATATNPGKGGSTGSDGTTMYTATYSGISGWGNYGGNGGFPGGGGGGGGGYNGDDATLYNQLGELGRGGDGGGGALRIMWGPTRTFPVTLTANQLVVEYNSGVSSITISNASVDNFGSVTSNWSWNKWLIDIVPLRNVLASYTGQNRDSPIARLAEFTLAPGGNYGRQSPYLAYGAVNANRANSRIETTYAQSTVRPTANPVNARENLYYFNIAPGLRNNLSFTQGKQLANTSPIENRLFDVTFLRRLVVVRDPLSKTQQIAIYSPDAVGNFYAQSTVATTQPPVNARENLYYFNIAPGLRNKLTAQVANTSTIENKVFDVTTLVKPIVVLKNPLPKLLDQHVFDVWNIKSMGKLNGINVNLKSSNLAKQVLVLRPITAELNVDNVDKLKIKNTSVNVFSIDIKVGRTSFRGIRLDSPKIDEKIFDPAFLARQLHVLRNPLDSVDDGTVFDTSFIARQTTVLRNPLDIIDDGTVFDVNVTDNFYAQSLVATTQAPINARENLYYFNIAPGLRNNVTFAQGRLFTTVDQDLLDSTGDIVKLKSNPNSNYVWALDTEIAKLKASSVVRNPLPKRLDQIVFDVNSLRAVSVLRSPFKDNIVFDSNGMLKMEFGKRRGSTGIADIAVRKREPLQFWN